MNKIIDDIPFDQLTIRQLRTILFEFYNQDKPLVEVLMNCVDKTNQHITQGEQEAACYLFNMLFNRSIKCEYCGEQSLYCVIDEDENWLRFYHDEEHGYNDCCVFDLTSKERLVK